MSAQALSRRLALRRHDLAHRGWTPARAGLALAGGGAAGAALVLVVLPVVLPVVVAVLVALVKLVLGFGAIIGAVLLLGGAGRRPAARRGPRTPHATPVDPFDRFARPAR